MNLLQVINEKISKKQIIAVFAIWIVKDIEATPEIKTVCIAVIAVAALLLQWSLDRGQKPKQSEESSSVKE